MRDQFLQMLKRAPYPKWKPAYAGILVGPSGSLWVRTYTEPDKAAPIRFEVLDSTGQWLGHLRMPAGFVPSQVANGFAVGTWKDVNDVVHVRAYRVSP